MNYVIRPLDPWIEPVTSPRRGSHVFKASWIDTLQLLARELEALGGTDAVLQLDVREHQLRRDGMIRADAKMGPFPGVRLSFDSVHGPLTYATDAHEQTYPWAMPGWQANVRAVALALEALRAVDRYGVSGRGEQYRGWTAIEQRPAEMTRDQAAEFTAQWAHPDEADRRAACAASLQLGSPSDALAYAYRLAAKRVHPDRTGDDGDTMARLNAARDLLNQSP